MTDNGIFDKYGLIDSCINDLLKLRVPLKDFASLGNPIIDVINRLVVLKDGLKADEKSMEVSDAKDQPSEREIV